MALRWCDGTFLEDQDHWFHAGIHREVYLYSTGEPFIDDVKISAALDEQYENGLLRVVTIVDPGVKVDPEYAATVTAGDQTTVEADRVAEVED